MTSQNRAGRPTKAPARGAKRIKVGLVVSADIKRRLDKAAKDSGVSLSAEFERRVELSFAYERTLGEWEAFQAKVRAEIARGGYARPQVTPPPTTLLDLDKPEQET